jgi:response regulator RpfG family c-di-GMP phosphodiesterase
MSDQTTTILVVDDEEQVVESLKRTLRHENFRVLTCTSPLEAIRLLDVGDVDILLSDIDMPEMTGLELIAETRVKHPDVVRMLLTGDSSLQSALAAINDGAVHKYLTKPWRSNELRENLRAIVAGLDALKRESRQSQAMLQAEAQLEKMESLYPGFANVRQVDGAYLLNDMHASEHLESLGVGAEQFEARLWLPGGGDRTENLRGPGDA